MDRVTSCLPDQLSRLELKLDGLSKETLVLKSLSLDSSSTIEQTSKAVRHLLKGKGELVQRSGQKPEALALEGPSTLSEGVPVFEGTSLLSEGDPLFKGTSQQSPTLPEVSGFLASWRAVLPR